MKVIRKVRNVYSFGDLDSGDVFKLSETGHLFMKIDNPNKTFLNGLDIEEGKSYEFYSTDEVLRVDGCFVEGMDEHDD